MATYTAARDVHQTLVANTADTVNLTTNPLSRVEVCNHATTGDLYVRTDGTAAAVAADLNVFVGPGQRVLVPISTPGNGNYVLSLVSASAILYSVHGYQ